MEMRVWGAYVSEGLLEWELLVWVAERRPPPEGQVEYWKLAA